MNQRRIIQHGTRWIRASQRDTILLLAGLAAGFAVSMGVAVWAAAGVTVAGAWVLSAVACALAFVATASREVARRASRCWRRNAELADLLRAITIRETVTEIAHGINQPLSAIVNYAEGCMLRLKAGAVPDDALGEVLNEIVTEGLFGGMLLRRLCSTVPEGSLRPESVDVGEAADHAVQAMEGAAMRHGIAISVERTGGGPVVRADRREVELAIVGLIEMGIQAISEANGGRSELMVEVPPRRVPDVALGIERKPAATRLTAPVFSSRSGGFRSGAWITRSIAESSGGGLWGTEDAAGGATFQLALPVEDRPRDAGTASAAPPAPSWRRPFTGVVSVYVPAPAGRVAMEWATDDGLLQSREGNDRPSAGGAPGPDAEIRTTNG